MSVWPRPDPGDDSWELGAGPSHPAGLDLRQHRGQVRDLQIDFAAHQPSQSQTPAFVRDVNDADPGDALEQFARKMRR